MRSNSAFVWVAIVDRRFGNETVMVFHNRAIDDDSEDGVAVAAFDVAAHGDMVVDVVLWVVEFRFLYMCTNTHSERVVIYI